jgi:signal transduction histidine kinase
MASRSSRVPYVIAVIWLLFTVSLASWWLSVGLTIGDRAKMFAWEGGAFIILLIAGGLAMVVVIRREQRRRETVEAFFMSFTHDLKTSLARVQLQAEGLREDWPDLAPHEPLDRLLHDTVRLQIQLENSLFVAQPDGRLLRERLDVVSRCERLLTEWPGLAVTIGGDGHVLADARGFDSVLRNILQNSAEHGRASKVTIHVEPRSGHHTRITITDDGTGVESERRARLGFSLAGGGAGGGSGVGLFVCRQLIARMHGVLRFEPSPGPSGLAVVIDLPGADR